MKKLIRSSTNSARKLKSVRITAACQSDAVFTPENVAEFLSQIPALSNYEIGLNETPDGVLQYTIGDEAYNCHWVQ